VILQDGRYLSYYEFVGPDWTTITGVHPNVASAPRVGDDRSSELRWNPLLSEWVVTATHRQDRTFLPPADFCPFCPATETFAGEVPESNYDIVVLENRFPSLQPNPGTPSVEGTELYLTEPARGVCEVVLYSQVHSLTLADAPVQQIYKLILVWTSRWRELKKLAFVKYIFVFENKGEAIGVTLHHPHGQIYAYPFVPPQIQKEIDISKRYTEKTGDCLICTIGAAERRTRTRVVTENETFSAFIPFSARWPYELHVVSRRHFQTLADMTIPEQKDLASILKTITAAYDALFERSFPYIMALHQAPSSEKDYAFYHFHIEFYPPLRSATKLKFLAGSETGAGLFINDTLPEIKAAELRARVRPPVWP
jgi:UDPglucose--hexose-1-phosphate uridylyltransferase